MVRCSTFEIRWHDTQPIFSCSFQPINSGQLRKVLDYNSGQAAGLAPDKTLSSEGSSAGPSARTSQKIHAPVEITGGQNWRLATAGGDNNVRIWLVKPGIPSPGAIASAVAAGLPTPTPHPPRVEYQATLSRHTGTVNCVRFSPSGDMLASAGDDGTVMLWHLTDRPVTSFGDADDTESAFEKEHWRMSRMIRASTQGEIYDMAWSPNGEHLVVGGTDFVARIINPHDGSLLREFSDHTHYVQGVAWDPLNEYLATQSSDRSVHVHTMQTSSSSSSSRGPAGYVPPVTRNSKMDVHRRTASGNHTWDSKPTLRRGSSHTSQMESDTDDEQRQQRRDGFTAIRGRSARSHTPMEPPTATPVLSHTAVARAATPTPASSVPQSPAFSSASVSAHPMNPPQRTPSRRSSFSGSQAEGATSPPTSVASFNHAAGSSSAASIYKAAVSGGSDLASVPARRSLSRTRSIRSPSPAPLPAIRPPPSPRQRMQAAQLAGVANGESYLHAGMRMYGDESFTSFFRRLTFSPDGALLVTPSGIFDAPSPASPTIASPSGSGRMTGLGVSGAHTPAPASSGPRSTVYLYGRASLTRSNAPLAHLPGHKAATLVVRFSPILYELRRTHVSAFSKSEDGGGIAPHPNIPLEAGKQKGVSLNLDDEATAASKGAASPGKPVSMIGLPYRMVFAVATHDVVWIYDTQQGGPLCCFSNMHYAAFTDLTWSADGQTLIMSSSDGYCSIAAFDYGELGTPYSYSAQPALSAQALANLPAASVHHSANAGNAVSSLTTNPASASGSAATPNTLTTKKKTATQAPVDSMGSPTSHLNPSLHNSLGASLLTPPPQQASQLPPTSLSSSAAALSPKSAQGSLSALGIGLTGTLPSGLSGSHPSPSTSSSHVVASSSSSSSSSPEEPRKKRRIQPTLHTISSTAGSISTPAAPSAPPQTTQATTPPLDQTLHPTPGHGHPSPPPGKSDQ